MQVADGVVAQALSRDLEHLLGAVKRDHVAVGQALQEPLGDVARAAAGVEAGLVPVSGSRSIELDAALVIGVAITS